MGENQEQHSRGSRQLTTRKRQRGGSHRRMANCLMHATTTRIIWPALLMIVASPMVGTMYWDISFKIPHPLSSLFPVASAFSPTFYGKSRDRSSKNLASSSRIALSPDLVFQEKEVADDRKTKRSFRTSSSGNQSEVEVWDGVFSPEVCKELHELAVDHSERTTGEDFDDDESDEDDSLDGSSIFYHRGHNRSPEDKLTPIEQALDSFLTAYYDGDDEQHQNRQIVVEYWCRQEHLNLEAHADIDEVWFERSCDKTKKVAGNHLSLRFRYPAIGHVLYLTKPTLGVGPTCVFPPKARISTDTLSHQEECDGSIRDEIDSVVTVPAVPGRVLRFPGRALHAVPKPADVWFSQNNSDHIIEDDIDDDEEEDNYDDGNDYEINDEWDDDDDDDEWDDDDDDDEERSVILFNTWEVSAEDISDDLPIGPIGVPRDPMFNIDSDIGIVEMMMSSVDMDGVEVDEDFVNGMVQYAHQQRNLQLQQWGEKYCQVIGEDHKGDGDDTNLAVVYSKVHCEPRESWKLVSIDTNPNAYTHHTGADVDEKGTIFIPLMGDKLRRRYPHKAVRWTVASSFAKGVKEHARPCKFRLTE